jgi:bifunctional non-homologous end joining protein LigD
LGSKFPEVKDSIAALDLQDAIIDGEIVALDEKGRSSFQLLQSFDIGQQRPPIVFYAFDLLQLNGKDLQGLSIEERKAELEELLKKPPGVIRYSASFTKDIPELLGRAQKLGLEGLIAERSGSKYEAGRRTGAWIKIKLHLEQEFVIGGYTEPEGSRKFAVARDCMCSRSHFSLTPDSKGVHFACCFKESPLIPLF